MDNKFTEALDALCEKFGLAIDWTKENVQPYLSDLMERCASYWLWTHVMWVGLGAALLILGIVLFRKSIKMSQNEDCHDYELEIASWTGGVCCTISSIPFIFANIPDIIEAIYLPEKIFIEMLMKVG